MSVSVCLSVCLPMCLSAIVFPELHVRSSQNFLGVLPIAVAWSSFGGVMLRYALGYRHAGCLQLSHVLSADPSADGLRSAASPTAIGNIVSALMCAGC